MIENNEIVKLINVSKKYKIVDRDDKIPVLKKVARFFKPKYIYTDGLKDISLSINKGDFIGLIGENGAGKTTTIKLMTGILTPTSGEISIFDLNPNKNRKKYTKKIGVVMG